MIKNIFSAPVHSPQEMVVEGEGHTGRPTRIRPRLTILLGVAILGITLAILFSGRILASQGQVAVAAQPQNDLLSARAYQFTGQGKILGGSGAIWMIGGIPIVVGDQTQMGNGIHPGEMVSVLGQISKDGKWLAESINPIPEQDSFFSFGGPVGQRSQTSWQVAGISLLVNDKTQLGTAIQDNELVVATFKVNPDGTWLALKIEALSSVAQAGTPTPAQPSVTSEPTTDSQQIESDHKPPAIIEAGKSSACFKTNGKGDKKHNGGQCIGSGDGNDNHGDNEGD